MSGLMQYVATHRKAILAGLLAAIAASSAAGGTVQTSLIAAVVAAAGGGFGVGAIPNRAKPQ